MIYFTRQKFLSFSLEKQHKKCAELLRVLYSSPSDELLFHYNELQHWIGEEPLNSYEKKAVSDRYHHHLNTAKVGIREPRFLPSIRTEDRFTPSSPPLSVAIYLDNIRSAHNVGSILRTVEAFQLGPIFFSKNTPFADHPQVRKTAMGSAEWVSCQQCDNLETLPRPLIALETSSNASSIHDFLFPSTLTLAVGNEEYGCSEALIQQADLLLEIPLFGRKNSLNVANAFAIAASLISSQLRDCPMDDLCD